MKSKGYILLEHGVLIAIVITAICAMSAYICRSVQGKIRRDIESISGRYEYGGKTKGTTMRHAVVEREIIVSKFKIGEEDYVRSAVSSNVETDRAFDTATEY